MQPAAAVAAPNRRGRRGNANSTAPSARVFHRTEGCGVDGSASESGLARGLLFEVREFYGPCRIVVELVAGAAGAGGTGTKAGVGCGSGVGSDVLGRCEARLAEALVARGETAQATGSDSARLTSEGHPGELDSTCAMAPAITLL